MSVNHLVLIGRLVRDPELKYAPSGDAVANFRLAVNGRYKTRKGEKKEDVLFLDAEAWGGLAEVVHTYLKRGNRAFVAGPLKYREWKSKDGAPRSGYRLRVRQLQLLDPKGEPGAAEEEANEEESEEKADTKAEDLF